MTTVQHWPSSHLWSCHQREVSDLGCGSVYCVYHRQRGVDFCHLRLPLSDACCRCLGVSRCHSGGHVFYCVLHHGLQSPRHVTSTDCRSRRSSIAVRRTAAPPILRCLYLAMTYGCCDLVRALWLSPTRGLFPSPPHDAFLSLSLPLSHPPK